MCICVCVHIGWAKKRTVILKLHSLTSNSSNILVMRFFSFVDNFDVFIALKFQINRFSIFFLIGK